MFPRIGCRDKFAGKPMETEKEQAIINSK